MAREDHHGSCIAWVIRGECETNPDYMAATCAKSCNNEKVLLNIHIKSGSCCQSWRPSLLFCGSVVACGALYTASQGPRGTLSRSLRAIGFSCIWSALCLPGITFISARLDKPRINIDHAFDVLDLIEDVVIQYNEPLVGTAITLFAMSIAVLSATAATLSSLTRGVWQAFDASRLLALLLGGVWCFASALEGLEIPLFTHDTGHVALFVVNLADDSFSNLHSTQATRIVFCFLPDTHCAGWAQACCW